jgi:hypothetical protein
MICRKPARMPSPLMILSVASTAQRVDLILGLGRAVQHELRLRDRAFGLLRDAAELRQRGLRQVEPHADLGDGVLVPRDRRKLRTQADGQPAVETETGIAVRLLAGAELTLQIVELFAHGEDRLQRHLRAAADA